MNLDYLNQAFRSLEALNEELFTTDSDSLKDLSDFMNSDAEEKISIIDMDAETEDDLQVSYIGKIICECNVCHSHIFRTVDEISIDAEGIVEIDQDCPYCGEDNGFVIIGQIQEFNPIEAEESEANITDEEKPTEDAESEELENAAEEAEEITDETSDDTDTLDSSEETDAEDSAEVDDIESIDESLTEASPRKYKPHTLRLLKLIGSPLADESLSEDFKNVTIETDDQLMTMSSEESGKVTVTTEPIQAEAEENELVAEEAEAGEVAETESEVISPVAEETKDEIIADAADPELKAELEAETAEEEAEEVTEESPAEEAPASEEAETEVDIDEVDEEAVNELGESYLTRIYENVESFKTTDISSTDTQLFIEGDITFKSGNVKKTGFIFEAKEATADGKVKFIGENAHFCRGKKAFTLVGSVTDKKLISESLTYNYRAKDADGKSTRLYGTISRNK